MKSRAEALDHSLESLKSSFESISQLSTSLATVTTLASASDPTVHGASAARREPTNSRGRITEEADGAAAEVLKTPKPQTHRRRSSRSDDTHATSPPSSSATRQRSTSSATLSPSSPSSAPPPLPTMPFSPVLHLSALLALPIILQSLLLPSSASPPQPTAAATTTAAAAADHRARADSLWGTWEPALRSWEDAGVPGVREVGMECRDVLRSSAARRRSSMSVGAAQSPPV